MIQQEKKTPWKWNQTKEIDSDKFRIIFAMKLQKNEEANRINSNDIWMTVHLHVYEIGIRYMMMESCIQTAREKQMNCFCDMKIEKWK